jgi:hypothetical protein
VCWHAGSNSLLQKCVLCSSDPVALVRILFSHVCSKVMCAAVCTLLVAYAHLWAGVVHGGLLG